MEQHEQDIIQKFKNGDQSGLRMLFDLYYTPLCVFAYKYFDCYEKAEDIVQEAFINLWEKERMIEFTGSIKSYLFSIVRNNSITQVRKECKYRFEEIEDQAFDVIEENFENLEVDERREKLYKEIAKLPAKSRLVFESIVFDKMKYAEVAEDMDISINTVKTQHKRALKQLRNNLDVLVMILLP